MSKSTFSDDELLAYLDEMLPAEKMATVEKELRDSESLRKRTSGLVRLRDRGIHSVGAIWRQKRLSCPSRSQLGSYLLGTLEADVIDYLDFHVRTVGCRYCAANLADLESQQADAATASESRRRKYYQSSVGHLRKP